MIWIWYGPCIYQKNPGIQAKKLPKDYERIKTKNVCGVAGSLKERHGVIWQNWCWTEYPNSTMERILW